MLIFGCQAWGNRELSCSILLLKKGNKILKKYVDPWNTHKGDFSSLCAGGCRRAPEKDVKGLCPVVCYRARLENVSSVYGATWRGKSSDLSTERLCKHIAHGATHALAAPFLGHRWVLGKWQDVSSSCSCRSLRHLLQPLRDDVGGTAVCVHH